MGNDIFPDPDQPAGSTEAAINQRYRDFMERYRKKTSEKGTMTDDSLLRITREAECAEIEKCARKVFDKLEKEARERLKGKHIFM
jgi:hypothetical protein